MTSLQFVEPAFDSTFSSAYTVIIAGTEEQAQTVRGIMWEYNRGMFCSYRAMSEDEYKAIH